jgi:hypothetical protein
MVKQTMKFMGLLEVTFGGANIYEGEEPNVVPLQLLTPL